MNLAAPNILVVDDKDDAGLKIIKALWDGGFSARFIQYDGRVLKRIAREKSAARGVRVVFMDINLISGAMGTDAQNFSAIQMTLETILAPDNGPYLLVTWSSHDDYADRLFAYLNERLELRRRPVATKRLSKTDFEGKNAARLPREVKTVLSDLGAAGCLIGWESLIREAGVTTINKISTLASDLADGDFPDRNLKLGAIIRAFAEAEAADHMGPDSAFPALASVLSHVLYDDAFSLTNNLSVHHGPTIMEMSSTINAEARAKINQALHIEFGGVTTRSPAPGDVFIFPPQNKRKRGGLPVLEVDKFVPEQFFDVGKWKKTSDEQRKILLSGVRLVIVEITPPCDHARLKKFVWHRYVVGIEARGPVSEYVNRKADYLKTLPTFATADNVAISVTLNSRATASVSPSDIGGIGKRLYRLRSQVMSDVIRWVSSQQSRLGYLEL